MVARSALLVTLSQARLLLADFRHFVGGAPRDLGPRLGDNVLGSMLDQSFQKINVLR